MPTARKPATRRKKVAAQSIGLAAPETAEVKDDLDDLAAAVEKDGGAVLARYRDPVGGKREHEWTYPSFSA